MSILMGKKTVLDGNLVETDIRAFESKQASKLVASGLAGGIYDRSRIDFKLCDYLDDDFVDDVLDSFVDNDLV